MLLNLLVFAAMVMPRIEADGCWEIATKKALPLFSELCITFDFFGDMALIITVAMSGYGLIGPCALFFAYGFILDTARIVIMILKKNDLEEMEGALFWVGMLINTFEEAP